MKKTYLLGLVAILAAILIIVSASKDISTYGTFEQAARSGNRVKIAGEIDKDHDIQFDPANSPNTFSFHMVDIEGGKQEVLVKKPKPQDFELSETVVATGRMENDIFVADEVLLKCASKYKDEEIQLRAELQKS